MKGRFVSEKRRSCSEPLKALTNRISLFHHYHNIELHAFEYFQLRTQIFVTRDKLLQHDVIAGGMQMSGAETCRHN
jgi:hypothetical protein